MADYISPWGGMPAGTNPLYGYSAVPDAVKQHFANYMSSGGMNIAYQDPETGLYWQAQNTLPGGEGEPGNMYGGYRVYKPSADGGFNWEPGSEGTGYDLYKDDGSYAGSEGFNKPTAQATWNLGLASVIGAAAAGAMSAAGQAGSTAGTAAGDTLSAAGADALSGVGNAATSAGVDTATMGAGSAGGWTGGATSGLGSGTAELGLGNILDAGIQGSAFAPQSVMTSLPMDGSFLSGLGTYTPAAGEMLSLPLAEVAATEAGKTFLQQAAEKLGASKVTELFKGGSTLDTIGKLAGIAAPFVGGAMQANASDKAADQQAQAAREANDLAWRIYQDQRGLQQPALEAGNQARNRLLDLLGMGSYKGEHHGELGHDFTIDDFYANKDPGYQFRMNEGQKALESSAANRGRLFSGATGKALTRYGQDFASNEYGKAFDRNQVNRANKINPLMSLAGHGQTAANTVTGAAGTYGQTAGNNITAAGNAQAAGTVGGANAWSNAMSGALNQYQVGQQQDQMQPYYNALTQRLLRP